MPKLSVSCAVLAVLCLLTAGLQRPACAHEIEAGGFVGAHLFSTSSELGRADLDPRDNAALHSFAVGGRFGYAPHPRVMLEAELALLPTTTRDTQADVIALAWRAHVLVHLLTGRWRPFVLLGAGGISALSTSNGDVLHLDTDEAFHAGAGLKFDITKSIGLRLDGRLLLVPRVEDEWVTPEGEVFLGAYWRWGGRRLRPTAADSDGDGIPNDKDVCPTQPEDVDGYEDQDGCPDPDNDGDGVLDEKDKCPKEAGPAENRGCPDGDKDSDGVVDRLDKCPKEAGPAETQGCPVKAPPPPPDKDGDGVLDKDDKCPDQAGDKALSGCPDQDGDGVADKDDKCPDKPETKNGFQDDDGCPDQLPKAVAKFTGVIKGINFKTGKDEIAKPSFKVLDGAAKLLREYPNLRVEISGHTDDAGDRAANVDLSQRRAEAVRQYLIKQGVGESRLTAVGYGPDRPIADNKKKAGKAKNRRVEFKLL